MKIKILGNTWEVREATAKEIGDIMATDKRYTVGACDYYTKTIYILKDLKEEIKKEILIHEITHAILYATSLNEHLTSELQEQYCEFLRVAYPIVQDVLIQVEGMKLSNHCCTLTELDELKRDVARYFALEKRLKYVSENSNTPYEIENMKQSYRETLKELQELEDKLMKIGKKELEEIE